MNTMGNKPLVNWVVLVVPLDSDRIAVLLYGAVWSHPSTESEGLRFFFTFCWWAPGSIRPISTAKPRLSLFPHFTSLVINGLCQSSGVIGCTSLPVKRLISMLLCGWLKAMINTVMAFTQDLFCCGMRQSVMLVVVFFFLVNVFVLNVFFTVSYRGLYRMPEKDLRGWESYPQHD